MNLLTLSDSGFILRETSVFITLAFHLTVRSSRNLSQALTSLFSVSASVTHRDTTVDRTSSVSDISISPAKIVIYSGQRVSFTAVGRNTQGITIQGTQFSWSSSDPDKLQVDSSGLATPGKPGLVWVIASTPKASTRVPVFIKPGTPSPQSDSRWRDDQDQLQADGSFGSASGIVSAMLNALVSPAAYAQSGGADSGDFPYDELWSEPRNLVGSPRNRIMASSAIGPVLPESNNFEFSVPLYGLSGRGLSLDLGLSYNSRIWSRHGSAVTFNAINSWPYIGFTLSFGRIVTYGTPLATKFLLVESDGTLRYLGSGPGGTATTYQTNDGSHITYVGTVGGGTLYYNNGTQKTVTYTNNRLLVTRVMDANGNYVQIAYKSQPAPACGTSAGFQWNQAIDTVTDTLGRITQFHYDTCNNLISIEAPGYGGTAMSPVTETVVRFDYQMATASTSFSGVTTENVPSGPVAQLRRIYFPATGTGYKFTYSAYGMVSTVSLRKDMSYSPTLGAISDGNEKAYVSFNYPASAASLTDAPSFSQWTQSPAATSGGTATYSLASSSNAGAKVFTVTNPDATTVTLTRSDSTGTAAYGMVTQAEVKTSGGASMAKSVMSYTTDGSGSPQVANVVTYDDATPTANQAKVGFDYDSYGNITNTREYGFQQGGAWVVRRRTRNVYKTDTGYINAYLRNLLIETSVYDAQLDTNDANDVMVSKSTYTYDDYNAMGGMDDYSGTNYAVGHLSSYDATLTVRGNLTGTTRYTDLNTQASITRNRQLDIFGNVVREELSCCNQRSMITDSSNGFAMPVSMTRGGSGATLTTVYSNDFNTSLQLSVTEPDNQQTTVISRDAALRPIVIAMPSGATKTISYDDSAFSVSQSVTYDDGVTTKTVTDSIVYDGWGRVIQQVKANGAQVNTSYDNMGRVVSVTNPFAAGGSPSYSTGYSYDAMGRATVTTLPDGQTVQSAYNGNSVVITDQVNRKIQRLKDGLGRLITVNEQNSSGTLSQATNYAYDLLNNLTEIGQGNQMRQYKYDALSRLLYEKLPEQTASINDGTGTLWTTKYAYTDFNDIANKTDARGVVTTYSYDALNRLSQVSYNTVSGVVTSPTVNYYYDFYSGTTAHGKLVHVTAGADYSEHHTFDGNYRPASTARTIGNKTYTTTYDSYNEADQLTQMTYASGRILNVGFDSIGRFNSLYELAGGRTGSPIYYLDNIGYSIAGQVTGDSLGNGVTEQFGYDAQRLQLTSQKAGTSSPYTNRLYLTYSYSAGAGGNGAGTTAGNSGQLVSVGGTINSTTESASYTYDNVRRLLTSNQTSNGSSAQRRFEYDRWGNRSGVWDATSGGTKIQSVSLQMAFFPAGSARTNRITSVTNSGSTISYSYDAAGNVTNDGAHSYTYDSENRLVSVDSGATAQYAYDHQNRRYKKTFPSGSTHYVWEGSHVMSEHNGSTGTVVADYVYSGSRLIAKVAGGTRSYFINDRLSARLTLDDSGAVTGQQSHLPYGEDFGETGSQHKQHFTSYERDGESGTDYAVNRHYNQIVGRFNRVDPYSGSGDISNPQSWNRYAYALNDAVNNLDELGLEVGTLPPNMAEIWSWFTTVNGGGRAVPGGRPRSYEAEPIKVSFPKDVKKNFHSKFPCDKNATEAMKELKEQFTDLASTANLLGFIKFESKPIELNARIDIATALIVYTPLPVAIPKEFHVNVEKSTPTSWTFSTESDHVFHPGGIKFSIIDDGNGDVQFSIDLEGETNGLTGTLGYLAGGSTFEDLVWKNLAGEVESKICGNK